MHKLKYDQLKTVNGGVLIPAAQVFAALATSATVVDAGNNLAKGFIKGLESKRAELIKKNGW